MNIKGLVGNIIPNEVRGVSRTERAIKSDETHDRDANGQEASSQQQEQREPMTDEQLEKALAHLRNLSSFKEHKWTVQMETNHLGRFAVVKDNLGTVIRRIPELELWTLPSDSEPRGQLLKKTA